MYSPGLVAAPVRIRRTVGPVPVTRDPLMRILIVEDHDDSLEALLRLLRMRGYAVAGARTGTEALEACEAADFDLMICDIGLPDIDGWDLVGQVRARCGLRAI